METTTTTAMASLRSDSLHSSLRSSMQRQCSLASFLQDCPICLDPMRSVDLSHVLQCERHCGFNMCQHCIGSLIDASKDDFQLASDGNLHVKVYLHCPNCRSDLSQSIRHTLLLRKVDDLEKSPESEWTSSQVRLKNVLDTARVQKAIQVARIMEADYFGLDLEDDDDEDEESSLVDDEELEDYVEQWGVEVDLSNHNSLVTPRPPPGPEEVREEAIRVDPTLFAGLDEFLTEDQRQEVTKLMTSGNPSSLVAGARILYDTLQNLSNPSSNAGTKRPSFAKMRTKSLRKSSLARRSSVFQLIAEAEEAAAKGRQTNDEKKVAEETQALLRNNPAIANQQHRQLTRQLQIQAGFQKRFPIPVRMPKTVKLDLSLPFDMELVDHTWGGTVMDAYSKINIGFGNKVTQKRPRNRNVGNILGNEPNIAKSAATNCAIRLCAGACTDDGDYRDYRDVYIALPGTPRVLISHTGHVGRLGAVKGDVLTHVDGESVSGKTVTEVLEIVKGKDDNHQEFILLTLNAELSVADALKRRSLAISEAL